MPAASTILMIRPAAFGYNEQTAADNYFQDNNTALSKEDIHVKALAEFDAMVQTLRGNGIHVLVVNDTDFPPKPSAVFPNNWLSTSPDGKLFVYPMHAPSRREEKRDDILQQISAAYLVTNLQDWSEFEAEGRFLEGTGSMVIDHDNQMIYAAVSERTSLPVLEKFASANGYQAIVFLATDEASRPVYHTNVVMTLGEKFCVLCEEAIEEEWELIAVRQLLESTGHVIVPITRKQMKAFAGNMLEVKNDKSENILVLSQTAFDALGSEQRQTLGSYARLLPVSVPTIEQVEGGSVRCMMAEVFLEEKQQ